MDNRILDLTNQKFNRLTVICDSGKRSHGAVLWNCKCDCGNIVDVKSRNLITGGTKSCGCLLKEHNSSGKSGTTHGLSNSAEYSIWNAMIQRCYNCNTNSFNNYIARDIIVCDRWRHSFENFYADMGPRPSDQHSIDRMNNDGNYEPSNCRWATRTEQNNNTRSNVFYYYKDKEYTVLQLAVEFNIKLSTLKARLNRGWSITDAIETPV